MIEIYLTTNAFGRVMPTLLSLIISVYLLTLKHKTRRTWLLVGYFSFMILFNLAYVLAYSIYDRIGTFSWLLASCVLFALLFKIQFAYHFPRLSFPREARIVLIGSALFAVGAYADYVVRFLTLPVNYYINNHYYASEYFSAIIPAAGLVAFLWSPVVMYRQWRDHRDKSPEEARAALRFVYVTFVEIAIAMLYLQDRFLKIFGPEYFEPIANAGVSLIFLLYVWIYLNISSEPSSFIARLVGISLLTVMVVTSTLGVTALFRAEEEYDAVQLERARTARDYVREGIDPREVGLAYLAEFAPDEPGASAMKFLYAADGLDPDDTIQEARVLRSNLGRGRLYRLNGQRRFVAYRIPGSDQGAGELEAGFVYEDYRRAMHGAALIHLLAMLAVTAFMLLGFPLFIYATVIGPLRRLLVRLRQAALDPEGGTVAPADSENEIEYLSRSFANMLNLLKEAKGRFYQYSEHIGEVEKLVENYQAEEYLEQQVGDRVLVCASPPMRAVVRKAVRFAGLDKPALVTGETGTGKELIARTMHYGGERQGGPFVPVNCAAVPAALWESEVFGHVRGAFTDARESRRGRVEEAAGGSLFFDEIGEMPLDMQAKMLRLLQERVYSPVGADRSRQAECRFIFATNRDLEAMIQAGTFREDLYYRINVFHVHIPPLRERGADIPLLVQRTLDDLARDEGVPAARVADRALAALVAYPWPGNIRELENVLVRAVAGESLEELGLEHLPRQIAMASPRSLPVVSAAGTGGAAPGAGTVAGEGVPGFDEAVNFDALVESYSRRLIETALRKAGGNKTKAAELLGMKRTRLRYRIKELESDGDAG